MALIRTCRTAARGGSVYVPGGAACAALGQRASPAFLRLSAALKAALTSPVVRLAASPA